MKQHMSFKQKLELIIKKNNSLLCIGLDIDLEKIPKRLLAENDPIFSFNKIIIDSTFDLVCSYKPNIAFYEAYGEKGHKSLKKTIEYIQTKHPEIPIILDAKRADIANTSKMYAISVFDYWSADAVTVYPHLGLDSILPFLEYKDKLTILLIKTSNRDSKMFQDISVEGEPYYLKMAKIISKWQYENIGIFVAATYPKELKEIRKVLPYHIFLSAGLGYQRADIKESVKAGINDKKSGIMFNVSRSIIYASHEKNFAKKARETAIKFKNIINKYRNL